VQKSNKKVCYWMRNLLEKIASLLVGRTLQHTIGLGTSDIMKQWYIWVLFCGSGTGCPATNFFARRPIFQDQLSHVENQTEPASQIPEEG
jgi:hypothetical protein